VECKPPATPPTTNGYDNLLRRGNLSPVDSLKKDTEGF